MHIDGANGFIPVTGGTSPNQAEAKALLLPELQKIVPDASASDVAPKGFPKGVSWTDAYKMVTGWHRDSEDSQPKFGILVDRLTGAINGTKTLARLGYNDLSRFPRGTSIQGAIDTLYGTPSNGFLAKALSQAGLYDLRDFPTINRAYDAFKLIEDPENPGVVSRDKYLEYQQASKSLAAIGITSLQNFPSGTTLVQARDILAPKAAQMLTMMGADDSIFANPDLSPLDKLAITINLPKTINQLVPLPSDTEQRTALVNKFRAVSEQAGAARHLGMMGYESLQPFKGMSALKGKEPKARDALALVKTTPQPFDLPQPAPVTSGKDNYARLFMPTTASKIRTYGTPNPVTKTVLGPQTQDRVTKNLLPPTRTVTAAEVLAFNQAYWGRR
jgi:hypothetical protein